MRRMVFAAAAALMTTMAGGWLSPAPAQQVITAPVPNNTPLSFGMNVEEASLALGTKLVYVRGRPGDEMFIALPNVKGAALSDRQDGLYLQFRHGKLEGWKGEWEANRPRSCCN
jgi:hypothetical protein